MSTDTGLPAAPDVADQALGAECKSRQTWKSGYAWGQAVSCYQPCRNVLELSYVCLNSKSVDKLKQCQMPSSTKAIMLLPHQSGERV